MAMERVASKKIVVLHFVNVAPNWREALLQQLEPDVFLFARSRKIPGMDMDDVAQELRFHLFKKLHLFNPTKSSLRTWGWMVMRNKLISLWRDADRLPLNHTFSLRDEEPEGLDSVYLTNDGKEGRNQRYTGTEDS